MVTIGANLGQFNKGLGDVKSRLSGVKDKNVKVRFRMPGFGRLMSGLSSLKSGLLGVAAAAAAAFGVGGLGIGFGVKLAAEAESATVALSTLFGSMDKAKETMKDLAEFAASTPFQMGELTEATRGLAAYGVAQDAIMDRLKVLGDIAAGTGKPIGDFVAIFGKVRSTGRASMEEINRLAERGVPIYKALGDQMGVAQSEVRDLITEGKVGPKELLGALRATTEAGGVFADGMKKQSQTTMGLWSTLKDNVFAIFKDIGEILIEELDFKGMMEEGITFVKGIRDWMPSLREAIRSVWTEVKVWWQVTKDVFDLSMQLIDDMAFAWRNMWELSQLAFLGMVAGILDAIPSLERPIMLVGAGWVGMWAGVKESFISVKDTMVAGLTELVNISEALVEGMKAAWDAIASGDFSGAAAAFGDAFTSTLAGQEDAKGGGNPISKFNDAFKKASGEFIANAEKEGGLREQIRNRQKALEDKIAADEEARRRKKMGQDNKGDAESDEGDPNNPADPDSVAGKKKKGKEGFDFVAVTDQWKRVQKMFMDNNKEDAGVKLQKQQLDKAEEQRKLAKTTSDHLEQISENTEGGNVATLAP